MEEQQNTASAIEALLNLPPGSTIKKDPFEVTPILTKGVQSKTAQLIKMNDVATEHTEMDSLDRVRYGVSLEQLENDKFEIRKDAFEVKTIARAILDKLFHDIRDQIGVSDRMYLAASKMIDSLNMCIAKLDDMNRKMRQEEEFKSISIGQTEENGTKQMTPDMWIDFIEAVKEKPEPVKIEDPNVQDATIV